MHISGLIAAISGSTSAASRRTENLDNSLKTANEVAPRPAAKIVRRASAITAARRTRASTAARKTAKKAVRRPPATNAGRRAAAR